MSAASAAFFYATVNPGFFRGLGVAGGERQRHPPAGRSPLHQRDDRLRTAPHQHHDVSNAALRVQRLGDAGRLGLSATARHRVLEVEPGAEIRAGALQHHDTGVAIALQALEIDIERIDQRGIERVEALGTIERDPICSIAMFDQQRLRHASLLHLRIR